MSASHTNTAFGRDTSQALARNLGAFIDRSPTPFHATHNLAELFDEAGFVELNEGQRWDLSQNDRFYVRRNSSSIIAFRQPEKFTQGIHMVGAHTDSPCLKIKPIADLHRHGYWQLGVEVYGGVLMHPWFDRDLSIAGRVSGVLKSGDAFSELIDFKQPVAVIPSLAIHLDREVNSNSTINAQKHLPLVLGSSRTEQQFNARLLTLCREDAAEILEYELCCYDTQKAQLTGLEQEFLASARLDNLLSSYIGAQALINSDTSQDHCTLFVATDHEEIGSASTCGAQGPFLRSVLERITRDNEALTQCIHHSMLISCDNAHGIHPNYADKHDAAHGPLLNHGPVIKINSNQRYATNSISSSSFQALCHSLSIPVQKFVVRSDMGCGSTIGPIIASELGVPTIDIGAPQWAMHSIRETAGVDDLEYLHRALKSYFES